MCMKVSFILLCAALNVYSHGLQYQKRQTQRSTNRELDSDTAETAFSAPAAVQASGKYFQDVYVAQHKPDELEFGHVYETPNDWEQRFEKINVQNNTRQGKVPIDYFVIWGSVIRRCLEIEIAASFDNGSGETDEFLVERNSFYCASIRYIHVPAPDHVEHGHRKGNEHHFIERHEKAKPHEGEFKTKVRWGDKHGGYGEHYWDFNHAGHDSHDGEESNNNEQYAAYEEESAPVPAYADKARGKREQISDDVEFISPKARSLVLSGITGKHGGNYKSEQDFERGKREQKKKRVKPINSESLFYKPETGRIIDQKTGIMYELKPVE